MKRPGILYVTGFVFFICVHYLGGKNSFEVTEIPQEVRNRLKLDEFHQKHIDLHGFSIIGSAKVSSYALKEAAYLIKKMVGNRNELLSMLNQNKARYVVMARDEFTTDIPEHSDLKPSQYWDYRARGLGATFARPAVTCGEENLLGIKGDPYAKENILIHEFAHALHQMALIQLNPNFQKRIEACYKNAITEKIWEGTYASTNENEYWAEGVQSWFNTNRENDHDHGYINTRKELKKADPQLAQLIKETFGDSEWRYEFPHNRPKIPNHFSGFNREKEKAFAWPEQLLSWQRDFESGKITLAPKGTPKIKPLSIVAKMVHKSKFTNKRNRLFIRNSSSKTIFLEWFDFKGNSKQRRILRPKEHQEINSFVGHAWQIIDRDSKKTIVRFVLPKSKTSRYTVTNDDYE
jgi:hypothetical protein